MSKEYIIAGEIIKIHSYLLKSPRLKYITGGSILIETFSSKFMPALSKKIEENVNIYMTAAGRFMVGFKKETNAVQFMKIVKYVGNHLFGANINLVCGPLENEETQENENNIIQEISNTLEQMKVNLCKKPVFDIPSFQYIQRCNECGDWGIGRRKVCPKDNIKKLKDFCYLCQLCQLKLLARDKKVINIELPEKLHENGFNNISFAKSKSEINTDNILAISYSDNQYHTKFDSFPDIVTKSNPSYIGVFYADGNEMGTLISNNATLNDYKIFSERISNANKKALDAAVKEIKDENERFPGLILINGGDDLLAVLPGDKAVDFAQKFMEEITNDDSPLEKGICGGLVFSPPNMPFTGLYDLADRLCTNAKNKIWFLKKAINNDSENKKQLDNKLTPQKQSAIDFMLVSSSLIQELGNILERQSYQVEVDDNPYILFTARPYLIDEFKHFIENIRTFKKIEPSRRVFMDLKDIFLPTDNIKLFLDENIKFIELENMIKRLQTIDLNNSSEYESFFHNKFLNNEKWQTTNNAGDEIDAFRIWQADIIEIVDFIKLKESY